MRTDLTIQQAANVLGTSAHTLRYYEREGLLGSQISRNTSGHRRYSEQSLLWVKLLLCLRETGMPMKDIKTFAELSRYGSETIVNRLAILKEHERRLDGHIKELHVAQTVLRDKIQRYEILIHDEKTAQKLEQSMRSETHD